MLHHIFIIIATIALMADAYAIRAAIRARAAAAARAARAGFMYPGTAPQTYKAHQRLRLISTLTITLGTVVLIDAGTARLAVHLLGLAAASVALLGAVDCVLDIAAEKPGHEST